MAALLISFTYKWICCAIPVKIMMWATKLAEWLQSKCAHGTVEMSGVFPEGIDCAICGKCLLNPFQQEEIPYECDSEGF